MKKHPYARRTWIRSRLPWFLIKTGLASKGKDCESLNAKHHWYKKDDTHSACYHCEVIKEGELWKNLNSPLESRSIQNSLFKNLKFIAKNLIFEFQSDLIGNVITINRKSLRIDHEIQLEVSKFVNLNMTLKSNNYRKRAIKKYGLLDLELELHNIERSICTEPVKVLRNERVLTKEEYENQKELDDARDTMSFMLEDDIKSIKTGKIYLKIFAKAKGDFISHHDLFLQGETKRNGNPINKPDNPDNVRFEIVDACITNLPGIWFNKHFYL